MSFELSPIELSKFFEVFQQANPQNNKLSGASCKNIFMQSGLSLVQLKEIWDISDIDADGSNYSSIEAISTSLYSNFLKHSNANDHITLNIRNLENINFTQFSILMQILTTNNGYIPSTLSEKDRIAIYDSLKPQNENNSISVSPNIQSSTKNFNNLNNSYTPGSTLAESYMLRKKSQSPLIKSSQVSALNSKSPLSNQIDSTTTNSLPKYLDSKPLNQTNNSARNLFFDTSDRNDSLFCDDMQSLFEYNTKKKAGMDLFAKILLENCNDLAKSTAGNSDMKHIDPNHFSSLLRFQINELDQICANLEIHQNQISDFIDTL
ncbi:hypothetical protein BB561_004830 [Smittium simulii]|uniref:EH domain-containing protein n=1 Tax=Smittium simulii TaxID=133385 RepID=A0A2T9YDY1_9FUNG|nr:hypothetical protein BB561_004830 [Smittium simulii]